jgi:hypothetical protein
LLPEKISDLKNLVKKEKRAYDGIPHKKDNLENLPLSLPSSTKVASL